MSEDQLQQHLQKGLYGQLQSNPDERKQYLGSLRERVCLAITNQQMAQERSFNILSKKVTDYQDYHALINANAQNISPYINLFGKHNIDFTLISDDTAKTAADAFGLLMVSDQAINETTINIFDKYPLNPPQNAPKSKSSNFLSRLFK